MARTPKVIYPTREDIVRGAELGRQEHQFDAERFVYNARRDSVTFFLVNGVAVEIPRSMLGPLGKVPRSELQRLRLVPWGIALEVAGTDVDVSVQGAIRSAVGVTWAESAGRVSTPKKAAAARLNGRKGGRPRKPVASAASPNAASRKSA